MQVNRQDWQLMHYFSKLSPEIVFVTWRECFICPHESRNSPNTQRALFFLYPAPLNTHLSVSIAGKVVRKTLGKGFYPMG